MLVSVHSKESENHHKIQYIGISLGTKLHLRPFRLFKKDFPKNGNFSQQSESENHH